MYANGRYWEAEKRVPWGIEWGKGKKGCFGGVRISRISRLVLQHPPLAVPVTCGGAVPSSRSIDGPRTGFRTGPVVNCCYGGY